MNSNTLETSQEFAKFTPPESRLNVLFPELELPYNLSSTDNARIHPLCLCPKDSVIVAKQDAPWAPNHVWGSCPIEKCNRANGLNGVVDFMRAGAVSVDGCARGVVMPPFNISATQALLDAAGQMPQQRSYGTYNTYCPDRSAQYFCFSSSQIISNVTLGKGCTISQENTFQWFGYCSEIKNVKVEGDVDIIQTSRGTLIKSRK